MLADTNENPFVGQPLYSKHLTDVMNIINEQEADHHLVEKRRIPVGPGGDAELVGVYEHFQGGLLFYFCDPYLKRVFVYSPDQPEPIYNWPIEANLAIENHELVGFGVGAYNLTQSALAANWKRSICVDPEGYTYVLTVGAYLGPFGVDRDEVLIFFGSWLGFVSPETYYEYEPEVFFNNWKIVRYVARYSPAGQNIQNFIVHEQPAGWKNPMVKPLYATMPDPQAGDLPLMGWPGEVSGGIAVHGDSLVCALDRAATWRVLDSTYDPVKEPILTPSSIMVLNKQNGTVMQHWDSPSFDLASKPEEMCNALCLQATAKGVYYIPWTMERKYYIQYTEGGAHPRFNDRYHYALVCRAWDGTIEMKIENDWDAQDSGTLFPFVGYTDRQMKNLPDWYFKHNPVGPSEIVKRGFVASENYLLLPLDGSQINGDPYLIQYVQGYKEQTQQEIEQGKRPEFELTRKAEVLLPRANYYAGLSFGGKFYFDMAPLTGELAIAEFAILDDLTEWYGYKETSSTPIPLGTFPDRDALAGTDTVIQLMRDLRRALERLVSTRVYFKTRPVAPPYSNPELWTMTWSEGSAARYLLDAAMAITANTYGITRKWGRWRIPMDQSAGVEGGFLMRDIDIGEVSEVAWALSGWEEDTSYGVRLASRFSSRALARPVEEGVDDLPYDP